MDASTNAPLSVAGRLKGEKPGTVPEPSPVPRGRRRQGWHLPDRARSQAMPGKASMQHRRTTIDADAPSKPLSTRRPGTGQVSPAASGTAAPPRETPVRKPQATSKPAAGLRSPPDGASRRPSTTTSGPDDASIAVSLPWLTAQRQARAEHAQRRLEDVQRRLAGRPVGESLSKALSLVTGAERDMRQIGQMLRKPQAGCASDLARRRRYWVQDLVARELPLARQSLADAFAVALGCNALLPKDLPLLDELYKRLDDAYDYVFSSGPPWSSQARQLQIQACPETRSRVDLISYSASGKALRALVTDNPETERASETFGPARYFQAPGLELTGLCDSNFVTLFTGLRHGILHAHELSGDRLSIQADDDALRDLFRHYRKNLSLQSSTQPAGIDRQVSDQAENDFLGVRTWPRQDLERLALSLQAEAGRAALIDLARATLAVSPEHLRQAINGAEVRFTLFSIALLTPADVAAWRLQNNLFHHADSVRMQVAMPEPGLAPATVNARCSVRQFALPAGNERLCLDGCHGVGAAQLERLLGPLDCPNLGGDALQRVSAMRTEAAQLRKDLKALAHRQMLNKVQIAGRNDRYLASASRTLTKAQAYLERLQRAIRTIEQCGKYLKRVWPNKDGNWPAGCDVPRKVGGPLLLLGSCMGEIPLLSCANGRDYSVRLQADAMLLAVIADKCGGYIESMAPAGANWEQARAALRGDGGGQCAGQRSDRHRTNSIDRRST